MSTWVYFLSMFFLYNQLVEGGYGDKSSSDNTDDSSTSYDDKPDEPTTTLDDGVIIEKAILTAEITPKASFNFIDTPKRRSQNIRRQLKKTYSDEYTKSTSIHNWNLSARNRSRYSSLQRTTPTSNIRQGIQQKNDVHSPNFTIRVFDSGNNEVQSSLQTNNKYNVDITPASTTYPKKETFQILDVKPNNSVSPVAINYENQISSRPLWNYPYTLHSFISPNEANIIQEKERLSQIEATQLYLKQIETAQEYAANVLAMQKALQAFVRSPTLNWNQPTSNDKLRDYITPVNIEEENPSQGKTVPRTGAPDLSNVGSKNNNEIYFTHVSQGSTSHPALPYSTGRDGSWSGPAANPIVLPSGFLADTDAVINARLAHLKALIEVIDSRSQRQMEWQAVPQQWRYI